MILVADSAPGSVGAARTGTAPALTVNIAVPAASLDSVFMGMHSIQLTVDEPLCCEDLYERLWKLGKRI
jgi:hypothetical protein